LGTTTLAEAFAATDQEQLCKLGHAITELDDDDTVELAARMADPKVTNQRVVNALEIVGPVVSVDVVARHRKQICRCCR